LPADSQVIVVAARLTEAMHDFFQDLRHALRLIGRSPGFTFAVVAALALGIGANTAIFSVINAVLLKPLPYPDPDRLRVFVNTSPQGRSPAASPTKFNVWRQQTVAFQDVAGYRFNTVNVTGGPEPEQVVAGQVSADFFRLFGAPMIAGRTFTADEDRPGGGRVAVLSEGFWRRRFGADPNLVGRTISINNEPHVVVGILGAFDTQAIQGPGGAPSVWMPFQIDPNSVMQGHFFQTAGRLRPDMSASVADEQLKGAAGEFQSRFPGALGPQGSFASAPLEELVVGNMRSSLLLLAGAVSLVLLIACANVANLLMVRATARRHEIAVRAAIGAGRGRIVRQLLTESLLLSTIGGAVGLLLGVVGINALLALNPGNIPRVGESGSAVTLDWRVLAFTAVVSLATGLIFGLMPALRASRTDLGTTLKEDGARSGGGLGHHKVRAALVVSEIGLALVLLVGSALFIRTFVALRAVEPGFDARQVLTMQMSLTGGPFTRSAAVGQLMRDGAERLQALPGVEVAGATCCVPLTGGLGLPFVVEGRPLEARFHGGAGFTPISPGYFAAFRIPIVRGRAFMEQDRAGSPNVAIINEAMAKQFWPKSDPLADRITIAKGLPELEDPTRQIVGVAGDVRTAGLNREPQPIMYVPWGQVPDAHNANLVGIVPLSWIVRTRGEPTAMSAVIQNELRVASGGLPVSRPRTMGAIVRQSTARSDFNMLLLTIFGASALLLAAIGIYGLMSYSVQQRTQEIGIRLALGADPARVRNMVIIQGMGLALAGVVIGLGAAFALVRLIESFLFGVAPRDPMVFVAAPLVLGSIAFFGVWLPARRAARVDPVIALRTE
jgi:predicted permease